MKDCFLIIANDNPKVLSFLISQLDDERNDIFIHLDLKSSLNPSSFSTNKAKLVFVNRTKCLWGHYSLIDSTLRLLEAALNSGNEYHYFHLLSGTTLCTKSQADIHKFFDNTDLEYFHVNKDSFPLIQRRCKYYYPFIKCSLFRKSKPLKALSILFGRIQFFIGINRLRKNKLTPLFNGFEWFSITKNFASYILSKEDWIKKTFKHTLAGDEVFVQTLAVHSSFKDKIYAFRDSENCFDSCKTFQFWNNGKSSLINSEEKILTAKNDPKTFFARKFVDKDIELVKKHLTFKD